MREFRRVVVHLPLRTIDQEGNNKGWKHPLPWSQ